VARIGASGATVTYCRFIGGAGIDVGQAIAVDPSGNAWVVGTTTSIDLPVRLALQPTRGGRTDGFLARLAPDALPVDGDLLALTYLGGSGDDLALAVATDAAGNAYITGATDSLDFPVLAARQPGLAGGSDAFVTVFNAASILPTFSTYLGGVDDDVGTGIAVHPGDGSIWVAGSTESLDFPLVTPIQPGLIGRRDAFVVRLLATGASLISATFLGGSGDDAAQALAVDTDGLAYVTGSTNSATFPTSPIRPLAGLMDAFVTQIAEGGFVQFAQATYQVSETGGSALITVRRSGDTSQGATVQFATADGTATAGADYTATSGTLTFAPGESVATFPVTVLPDTVCDGDETVLLSLSNPGAGTVLGTRSRAVLTILDPTACVNFSAPVYVARENRGAAQVIVNRSGSGTGVVTVRFSTANGTATAPADYTAVNRTVTFAPGVRNVTVPIPIVNDAVLEGVETVSLALASVQGSATLGVRTTATLEILDEDVGGTIQFSTAVYTVAEGGTAKITVIRTGSTAAGATVQYATSAGTATGPDYVPTTETLTFAAGQTVQSFTVRTNPDEDAEGVETVNLTLSSPGPTRTTALGTRHTAVLRIVDAALTLAFSQATYTVRESATGVSIPVELTGVNTAPVTVRWTATSGTALVGSDFGVRSSTPPLVTGVLTFPPGGSPTTVRRASFRVPILADAIIEDTETVNLTLTDAVGAPLVAGRDTATLSIVDDDRGGVIQFSAAIYTVRENAAEATITVIRSGSTASGATVDFTTSDGSATAGQDYTVNSGTLTFGAGETLKRFTVPILSDANAEGVETFILTLGNPGPNATTTLGARAAAVLRIVDDELALAFVLPDSSVRENAGTATIAVELTGINTTPVTVNWSTTPGTAVLGSDYGVRGSAVAPAGTLTFPPGGLPTTVRRRTFTVPILQDTVVEPTKTVNLALGGAVGAEIVPGRGTAVLSIVDDDRGGIIQTSAPLVNVSECASTPCTARVTLVRTGGLASGVTVDVATVDGTAVAGTDFVAKSETVTFAAGQPSLVIPITLLVEPGAQPTTSFSVEISNPGGGGSLGPRTTTEVRIIDVR
jgi:hypothetical protein